MERVDAAEKEASEVLHSLLSVERVEKHGHELDPQHQQQVCILHKTKLQIINVCIPRMESPHMLCSTVTCGVTVLHPAQVWPGCIWLGQVMSSHNDLA